MQLPDIDFASIRLHRKSQPYAFEELCCQLAGDEDLGQARTSFIRKGLGGDGGVECFATLSDGTEVGWQVKYYWDVASATKSLDDSLDKALITHPKMTRFIVCLPFDLSDSRKNDVKTALDKWTTWKDKRIAGAAASGRQIEIDRWDAFELKKRLTASIPTAAGRVAYWFGQSLLTPEWFRGSFERARAGLGERYSPKNHIDLPIRRVLEATSLDPRLYKDLAEFSQSIAEALAKTNKGDLIAVNACEAAVRELVQAAEVQGDPIPVTALRQAVSVAREAVLPWDQAQREAMPPEHPNPQASAISNLSSTLNSVARSLALQHWDHVDTRAMLVVGDAGSGKSHLLADVCDHAIENERPAVLILSGKLPDAEPWAEILKDLGLPRDLLSETFLGALNAAGEALGVRALLMIDALNEKNGRAIWPDRLAGLVHDVSRFKWVSLVLSCRSTYEHVVIPEALDDKKLPRVTHEGFSARQARQYLKKRGISLAEEPNSAEELETPLFLRICCDALALDNQTVLAHNLGGVTEIFDLYTRAITDRVNMQIGTAPQRRYVERAIDALAQEMADTGREEVAGDRAYELVSKFFPDMLSAEKDILFQLQNEGLLSTQPSADDKNQEEYRFTFQRMSDHAIAKNLLDRSVKGDDVVSAFSGDTPVRRAMADPYWAPSAGVIEALSVQLPERFGVELNDMPNMSGAWGISEAFETSLLTRSPKSRSTRMWELINQVDGDRLRYETLIALSTDPEQDHNAVYLDGELRGMPMPQRDATWSTHLATHHKAAERLVEWIREADQGAILLERASLAGLQLCWFLTTSDRSIRDTATKALVVLLADRPKLAQSLWAQFKSLDDVYVTERLVAAIYGASLQGRWSSEDLSSLVKVIHGDIVTNEFPANILTRNHAVSLIHFAKSQGALPDNINASPSGLTFQSAWPIEYVTEAQIESYKRTYLENSRHRDEIASSTVFDGDFARYQIDPAVRDFSVAAKGAKKIPTAEQQAQTWLDGFLSSASQEMIAAHDALVRATSEAAELGYAEKRDGTEHAIATFRAAVGEDVYAQWSAQASDWRKSGMFQPFGNRRDEPAEFNLAWARRWVCKRAHDLGWSESLHGAFDLSIRNDRHTHQVERIGKKYQWIALYELCARMADNLQPLPGHDTGVDVLRLRNIDPSLLVAQTEDDGWQRFEEPCFWVPPPPELPPMALDEALRWLNLNVDYVDGEDNIEVKNPTDDKPWLVLKGFENWRGGSKSVKLDTWRRIGCFVVRKRDLKKTLELIKNIHFQGDDDVPSARSPGFHSYLGEHPWSWRAADKKIDNEWQRGWTPRRVDEKPRVSIRPTTASYLAESGGYDASITQSINLNLPAGWLMDGMGLHLTDGATIKYVDRDGVAQFMDPSVTTAGRSAALIDREAFLAFLKKESLVAVWALAGEKNVYGEASRGFGGRWTYTRIFHSQGDDIIALERYQTHDAPGADQLASLRKEANEDSGEKDHPDDQQDDWMASSNDSDA